MKSREKWFFGLAVEENDSIIWLKSNKELLRQRVQKDANGVVQVKFLVKVSSKSYSLPQKIGGLSKNSVERD